MHGYCSEACLDKGADLLRDLDAWGDLPDEEDGDPGFPSLEGADEWLW